MLNEIKWTPIVEPLSINAPSLLRKLTRNGGVTRQALQTTLKVSSPTVTRTILELTDLGVLESKVTAAGFASSPFRSARSGRPPACWTLADNRWKYVACRSARRPTMRKRSG